MLFPKTAARKLVLTNIGFQSHAGFARFEIDGWFRHTAGRRDRNGIVYRPEMPPPLSALGDLPRQLIEGLARICGRGDYIERDFHGCDAVMLKRILMLCQNL